MSCASEGQEMDSKAVNLVDLLESALNSKGSAKINASFSKKAC